jgi:hypothetical protein
MNKRKNNDESVIFTQQERPGTAKNSMEDSALVSSSPDRPEAPPVPHSPAFAFDSFAA